jgi:hypothetical protein
VISVARALNARAAILTDKIFHALLKFFRRQPNPGRLFVASLV